TQRSRATLCRVGRPAGFQPVHGRNGPDGGVTPLAAQKEMAVSPRETAKLHAAINSAKLIYDRGRACRHVAAVAAGRASCRDRRPAVAAGDARHGRRLAGVDRPDSCWALHLPSLTTRRSGTRKTPPLGRRSSKIRTRNAARAPTATSRKQDSLRLAVDAEHRMPLALA